MTKTFAERCHIAQQFLPDAQYKAMLTALHTEMLAKLAEQPAPAAQQEPAYTYTSAQATRCARCGEHKHTPLRIDSMGGYVCLTCIDKQLCTPQAQPAPEIAIADAYRAGVDSGIAAEREACAQVCESQPMRQDIDVREQCAAAIRARGNT